MKKSKHFELRQAQRQISENDIEMTLRFGIQKGDKRALGQKSCQALIKAIDEWSRLITKAQKRGFLDLSTNNT